MIVRSVAFEGSAGDDVDAAFQGVGQYDLMLINGRLHYHLAQDCGYFE